MSPTDQEPADDDGPARVRPYALVRGRTRTADSEPTPVEAIVFVTEAGTGASATLERGAILRLCARPHSVAEVSAHLKVPVGVIRVLVADLEGEGLVQVNRPAERQADGTVDRSLLERVLAGLEAL